MSSRLAILGFLLCACAAEVAPSPVRPADAVLVLPAGDCLSAEATALTFNELTAGCSSGERSISIFSRCDRALPLAVSATPPFTVVGGPSVIAARGTATFSLRVGPSPRGRQMGTLAVRSLAQRVDVALTADAQPAPLVEDRFHVDALPNELDVLLVLDDGATMAPIAAHVREQLDGFRQFLGLSGQPRFGVLGATRGSPRFAKLATTPSGVPWLQLPATAAEFEQLTALTFTGQDGASCTEALLTAIDSGELARFRRPNVRLQVLCVTNQAESIEQPFLPALARVETELRRDAPWPTAVKLDVVARLVPRDGDCGTTGTIDSGRYAALVATTQHGQLDEVCDRWLVYQGVTHQGVGRKSLGLSGIPDFARAAITVSINGVDVPEGGFNWTYDPAANAVVVFFSEAIDVRVSYATACTN